MKKPYLSPEYGEIILDCMAGVVVTASGNEEAVDLPWEDID